jgi:RNA polymerase sigma factor (sigma-70 family)
MSAEAVAQAAPPAGNELDPLTDSASISQFRAKLVALARSRYRVTRDEADEIVQTAFAAYLQVRARYAHVADHGAILGGIFRNKCLTHLGRVGREKQRLARYSLTSDAARENQWIRPSRPAEAPSVLEEIVRCETRREIRDAIARLRPSSRRLISLLVLGDLGRKRLIDVLGVNKNTFDSRLHACRAELRGLLRGNDLAAWRPRTIGPRAAKSCVPRDAGSPRLVAAEAWR